MVEGILNRARVGIAGVNTRPLLEVARVGVAGNWSPALRREVLRSVQPLDRKRVGDRAAIHGWNHGLLFLDWTYAVVPDGAGAIRWRPAYAHGWGPGERPIPVVFDSAAYRIWTGTVPRWATLDCYCRAIEFARPDAYMAFDVFLDQAASLRNYKTMRSLGLGPWPVFHFRHLWDARADLTLPRGYGWVSDAERTAIANAYRIARDPVFRYYCDQAPVVAVGGLVHGPIPREARGAFLAALHKVSGVKIWGLGQASGPVLNQLARFGVLRQVYTDGTTFLHHARTGQFYVVSDGKIQSVRLTGKALPLFTLGEMAAANIRAFQGMYGEFWTLPAPAPLPDLTDLDGLVELRRRIQPFQATLLPLAPPSFWPAEAVDEGDVDGGEPVWAARGP